MKKCSLNLTSHGIRLTHITFGASGDHMFFDFFAIANFGRRGISRRENVSKREDIAVSVFEMRDQALNKE